MKGTDGSETRYRGSEVFAPTLTRAGTDDSGKATFRYAFRSASV